MGGRQPAHRRRTQTESASCHVLKTHMMSSNEQPVTDHIEYVVRLVEQRPDVESQNAILYGCDGDAAEVAWTLTVDMASYAAAP